MLRSRFLIVLAFALLALGFHGCGDVRAPTAKEASEDGATGAAVGTLIAGPAGAPIGAAIAILLGTIVRAYERGRLKTEAAKEKADVTREYLTRLENLVATNRTVRAPLSHPSEALTRNELG